MIQWIWTSRLSIGNSLPLKPTPNTKPRSLNFRMTSRRGSYDDPGVAFYPPGGSRRGSGNLGLPPTYPPPLGTHLIIEMILVDRPFAMGV